MLYKEIDLPQLKKMDEEIRCDYCDTNKVTLVCSDCFQGLWCSEECHQKDFEDHKEHHCFHPEDLSDECVLEEVDYATHDPDEARAMMKEMIGEDILIGLSDSQRRRKALRRQKRLTRKRRRALRRKRKKVNKEKDSVESEQIERQRLRTAEKAERREAERLEKARVKLAEAERKRLKDQGIIRPENVESRIVAFFSNSRVF